VFVETISAEHHCRLMNPKESTLRRIRKERLRCAGRGERG
jgi:hypothetical protein